MALKNHYYKYLTIFIILTLFNCLRLLKYYLSLILTDRFFSCGSLKIYITTIRTVNINTLKKVDHFVEFTFVRRN